MRNPRRRGDGYEKYLERLEAPSSPRTLRDMAFKRVLGSGSSAENKDDLKNESYLIKFKGKLSFMRNPRNRGNEYEKPLVEATHVRIWDKDAQTYVTTPLTANDRSALLRHTIMTGESFQRVKGSGSSAEKKGDLVSESYLVQAKRTDKKSFTVKLDDLRKAEKEAMNLGKKPLFMVGFYSEDKVTDEWVLIPKWMMVNEIN